MEKLTNYQRTQRLSRFVIFISIFISVIFQAPWGVENTNVTRAQSIQQNAIISVPLFSETRFRYAPKIDGFSSTKWLKSVANTANQCDMSLRGEKLFLGEGLEQIAVSTGVNPRVLVIFANIKWGVLASNFICPAEGIAGDELFIVAEDMMEATLYYRFPEAGRPDYEPSAYSFGTRESRPTDVTFAISDGIAKLNNPQIESTAALEARFYQEYTGNFGEPESPADFIADMEVPGSVTYLLPFVNTRTFTSGPHGGGSLTGCTHINVSDVSGLDFSGADDPSVVDDTAVLSIAAGTVVGIKTDTSNPGMWVAILHSNNIVSMYWHLDEINPQITIGKSLLSGAYLGERGNTGINSGKHWHLELRTGGSNYNVWSGIGSPVSWSGQLINGWLIYPELHPDGTAANYNGTALSFNNIAYAMQKTITANCANPVTAMVEPGFPYSNEINTTYTKFAQANGSTTLTSTNGAYCPAGVPQDRPGLFPDGLCGGGSVVKLYSLANYGPPVVWSGGTGFSNGPNADSYSMEIPNGWSVKTWRGDDRSGELRCWSSSVHNLQDHGWQLSIRSIEVFTSNVCPSANFDAWPQYGTAPFSVDFHIVSTNNLSSCLWNYGDGQTGTSCSAYHTHIYNNPGIYTVSLSVSGPGGSDSMTRTDYITVIAPPGPFGKITPTNGSTGQPASPTLTWSASAWATSYEYCIDTTASCTSWINVGTATSRAMSGLLPGTTYYWHVRAVNSFGTTYSNSDVIWSFTIGNKPGAFNKIAPANGATNQPTSLTLSWGASSGATSYEYCFPGYGCSTWISVGTATSVNLSGLVNMAQYNWHVRAVNSFGTTYSNGDLSNALWHFITYPGTFTDCQAQSQIPVVECQALVALYQSTNGSNWSSRDGWLVYAMPCYWYGIACVGGHVEELGLINNNLSGTLPPEVQNLTGLDYLNLELNNLTGNIPVGIGNLTKLGVLSLSGNQFSGPIPPELGQLTHLWSLKLSDNQLTNNIPVDIFNLYDLRFLHLDQNQLTGSLPVQIGNLLNLERLNLSENALSSQVPSAIKNLVKLTSTYVDIGYNSLSSGDSTVITFLDSKDPDWANTQTIPPANLQVVGVTSTSINLAWTPILYTGDGGNYQISYRISPSGSYILHGNTTNKLSSSYNVTGLNADTNYCFVIRTFTPIHGSQQNNILSDYSTEICIKTDGTLPGSFAKLSPPNSSTYQPTNTTLSWGGSQGATSYEYCYDTTNDNSCNNWVSNGNSTTKSISGLSSGTTYYWHVRARNANGVTYANGNTWWSFTTQPPAGTKVYLPFIRK